MHIDSLVNTRLPESADRAAVEEHIDLFRKANRRLRDSSLKLDLPEQFLAAVLSISFPASFNPVKVYLQQLDAKAYTFNEVSRHMLNEQEPTRRRRANQRRLYRAGGRVRDVHPIEQTVVHANQTQRLRGPQRIPQAHELVL